MSRIGSTTAAVLSSSLLLVGCVTATNNKQPSASPSASNPQSSTSASPDPSQQFDIINPCDLIPIEDLRRITGRQEQWFQDSKGQNTSDVRKAHYGSFGFNGITDKRRMTCMFNDSPQPENDATNSIYISTKTHVSKAEFTAGMERWNSDGNKLFAAKKFDWRKANLAVKAAYVVFTQPEKIQEAGPSSVTNMVVLTKYGTQVDIRAASPTTSRLERLMRLALSSVNGTRYPGK